MVLFNVYYNGATPTDFTVDLTENAVVRPNSVARLLKAYIPHKKAVSITNTKIMDLVVNDRQGTPLAISIPATGDFSITDLATQITTALGNALTGEDDNISGSASYDRTKGHGTGAFTINIKADSKFFTSLEVVDWAVEPFSDADFFTIQTESASVENVVYTKLGTRATNMSCEATGTGAAPTHGSFAQCAVSTDTKIKLDYFGKTTSTDLPYPPSDYAQYSALVFEIGADVSTRTFWGGCTNGEPGVVTGQPNDDVGKINELKNLPFCMVVPFTARAAATPAQQNSGAVAYNVGGFYAWEKQDAGNNVAVVQQANLGLVAGDQIAAVMSAGQHIEYWYKDNSGIWEKIDIIDGSPRYTVQTDDTLHPSWSIFESTAADQEVLKIVGAGFESGETNDYGRYIQSTLTDEFADALGFTNSPYTVDNNDQLANLKFSNEKEFDIIETSEDCPFVNVNITNLPLKAFVNYDTNQTGMSNAPTLGAISRFDRNGSMTAPEALYMDYPTHDVFLDNANELYISQLKFQIRDNDGKIPTDLDSPLSLVFELTETR
jgi:hypothetical protein